MCGLFLELCSEGFLNLFQTCCKDDVSNNLVHSTDFISYTGRDTLSVFRQFGLMIMAKRADGHLSNSTTPTAIQLALLMLGPFYGPMRMLKPRLERVLTLTWDRRQRKSTMRLSFTAKNGGFRYILLSYCPLFS